MDDPGHHPIERSAGQWLARRDRGLTPAGESEFRAWLAEDPRHRSAWEAMEGPFRALDRARALAPEGTKPDPDFLLRRGQFRRPIVRYSGWWAAAAGAAAAIAVGALWLRPRPAAAPRQSASALAGGIEPRTLSLPDGTVVELGAGAHLVPAFSAAERLVRLTSGEAHFAVARNPGRPFVVDAGGVAVSVVGTAFEVNVSSPQVEIVVTEGRVRVEQWAGGQSLLAGEPPASANSVPAGPAILAAGERVLIPLVGGQPVATRPEVATADELAHARGWGSPWLRFDETPLAEVVSEFNLQGGTPVRIADDATGRVRVTGTFRADGREAFLRLLESSFGVGVTRTPGGEVILSEAK